MQGLNFSLGTLHSDCPGRNAEQHRCTSPPRDGAQRVGSVISVDLATDRRAPRISWLVLVTHQQP